MSTYLENNKINQQFLTTSSDSNIISTLVIKLKTINKSVTFNDQVTCVWYCILRHCSQLRPLCCWFCHSLPSALLDTQGLVYVTNYNIFNLSLSTHLHSWVIILTSSWMFCWIFGSNPGIKVHSESSESSQVRNLIQMGRWWFNYKLGS